MLRKFSCTANSEFLYNASCGLININRNSQKIFIHEFVQSNVTIDNGHVGSEHFYTSWLVFSTVYVEFYKSLEMCLQANGTLMRLDPNERLYKSYPGFSNYSFDLCDIENSPSFSFPGAKQVSLKILKKYGNLINCPLKVGW